MVGFCSSPRFIEHVPGDDHPERPDRIRVIYRALHDAGLLQGANPLPELRIDLGIEPLGLPPLAVLEPYSADLEWILSVHTPALVQKVRETSARGGVLDQGDTVVSPRSYELALLSAGAVLRCCDAVMTGQVRRAFAAGRPPGHHAEPDRAMGFCLFNNVAIGARYLQRRYGVQRLAIVDFDVHHGNGTQAAFEDDQTVLFVSMHEHPRICYPGSGFDWEIGIGEGRGSTLNVPFDPGSGDAEYLAAMHQTVLPALRRFAPQVLLVSAGFDAAADDPLADINLSDDAFESISRLLVGVAERCCRGRLIGALEGGYNLRALGRGVVRFIRGLYA